MKNQYVKKIIAVMMAGTLILGNAGTWTASAAQLSGDREESGAEAEKSGEESIDAETAADVTSESETELTDDSSALMNQKRIDAGIREADSEEADAEIYTELMDYVDATSALLAKYPCVYNATLDIDIDSGEITDQNGETVDTMDDALEAAVDSDDAEEAAETLEESGYVVLDVDDTTVSVEDPYQTMRLIVTAKEGLSSSYGAEAVISYGDEYVLQYASTEDTINAYMALAADTCVDELYVDAVVSVYENEDDAAVSSFALSDADGEDVYLSWGVETMGLDIMQENLEATDTEESTEDDLEEVVVAVLDSGVNYENIYLDGRVLSDDGYDCYNEDDDPIDDYGHGTHVAGIIADGTSDNVMILPVKVIDSSGNGTVLTVKNGIRYALDYGVDIINLSLGLADSAGTADYFEELFQEALTNGCVITCAAGNSGTDVAYCYPAHSECTIAVSALTSSFDLAYYSNYGDAVDFSAPGSSIESAYYTSSASTKTMSGTSMATAHVTAAVALLKTWNPALSNDEIEELLEDYSVDLGDEGKDASYGYGYIYLGDFDVNQEADAQGPGDGSETVDLADAEVSLYSYTYTYNGNAKTPPVTVTYNGTTLTKNTDYTVVYTDNVNAGTALVTVTGKGNYTGSVKLEFVIEKASPKLTVDAEAYSLFPGDSEALAVSYKGDGELAYTSSDDSVASVSSDGTVTAVGEGTVIITVTVAETDNYESASASLELAVGSVQLSECTISLSKTEYTYDGTAHTPAVTVQYGNVTLIEDSDFTVDYSDNVNAGTAAKVTVTGLKNCTGTAELYFVIHKADQKLAASVENKNIYVGDTGVVEAVSDGDGTISYSSDHPEVVEVDDKGNFTGISAGTAVLTVVAEASDNYEESSEQSFTITVSGKTQTVTITAESASIKAGETTTVAATTTGDGKISYASSDTTIATVSTDGVVTGIAAGTATITATAEATTDYNVASASVDIKVGPVAPTITSVTNTASGVKIKWGSVTGADGYIIYRKVSGSNYSRLCKITGGSTLSFTDTSTSGGKTYYYKILAYTGSGSDVIKSSYSAAKKILHLSPGKITALRNTTDGMKLSWTKVSGASGYYIYRKASGGTYSRIATVTKGSTTSYTDTKSAKTGTVYYYAVKPYASDGTTGSYISAGKVRLCTPTLSSVKSSSSKKMTVKWSKKSSVTGYQIQYSTSSTFSSGNKTVTVAGSSKTSKTVSGLTRGKTYYVRIRTYKSINGTKYYSDWSGKKSVKIS